MHTRAAYRQQALQIKHMMDGMEAEARRKSASRVKTLKKKLSADKKKLSKSKSKSKKSRSLASVERSRARKIKMITKSKTRKTKALVKKERTSLKKKLLKIRRRKAKDMKDLKLKLAAWSCKVNSKTLSKEMDSLIPSGAQIDKLTKRSYKKLRKDVNGKLTEIGKQRTKCNKDVRSYVAMYSN